MTAGDVVITESFPDGVRLVRRQRPQGPVVWWWDVIDLRTGCEIVNFPISQCDIVRIT